MGYTYRYRGSLSFASGHHLQAGLDGFESVWRESERRPLFGALAFRRKKNALDLSYDAEGAAADFDPMWGALARLAAWAEAGSIEQRFDGSSPEGPVRAAFSGARALPPRHLAWDLLYAARGGDAAAIRELLERGADPDARCDSSDTCALNEASRSGSLDAVIALLEASVRLDTTTRANENALDLAATPAIAERLRRAGMRHSVVGASLAGAAYRGSFDVVMDIVRHEAPLPAHFGVGNAIVFAARAGRTEEALAIFAASASPATLRSSVIDAASDAEQRGHRETALRLRRSCPYTERELAEALDAGRDVRAADPSLVSVDRIDPCLRGHAWQKRWLWLGALLRRARGEDDVRFDRETLPRVERELESWHPLDRRCDVSDRWRIEPIEAHARLARCVVVEGNPSKIDWSAVDAAPQCASSSIVRLATSTTNFDAMLRAGLFAKIETIVTDSGGALAKALPKLLALEALRALAVPGLPLDVKAVRALSTRASLQGLDVSGGALGDRSADVALAPLGALRELRWLKLDRVALGDASMEVLSRMSSLRHVSLADSALTDAAIAGIVRCERLESLSLARTQVTTKGLGALAARSLRSLVVEGIAMDELSVLREFTALQTLSIATSSATDVRALSALRGLRSLDLSKTAADARWLVALEPLGALEALRLEGCRAMDDGALAELARFERLRVLDLRGTGITSAGLAALSGLESLELLLVSLSQFAPTDVSLLSSMPRLRVVAANLPHTSEVRDAATRLTWL